MEKEYTIPADTFKTTYKSLLKGLLDSYITAYNSYMKTLNPDYEINGENPSAVIITELKETKYNTEQIEASYDTLIDSIPGGVSVYEMYDGKIHNTFIIIFVIK